MKPKSLKLRTLLVVTIIFVLFGEILVAATVLLYLAASEKMGVALIMITLAALLSFLMSMSFTSSQSGVIGGLDLVVKTADAYLAWFCLHFIYWLVAIVNGFVIYLSFIYYISSDDLRLLFIVGITVGSAQAYTYFLFKSVGQRYEGLKGESFLGVSAFANLAVRMFKNKQRIGLSYLLNALNMSDALFNRRLHRPLKLDDVYGAVESLRDLDELPYPELIALAESLQSLPKRDKLPQAFNTFLKEMGWPSGFRRINARRVSGYQFFMGIVAAMTATGSILIIFQTEAHDFLKTSAGAAINNLLPLFAYSSIFLGSSIAVLALRYYVPIHLVRKSWHRKSRKSRRDKPENTLANK